MRRLFLRSVVVLALIEALLPLDAMADGEPPIVVAQHDPTNKNIFTFDYTVPTSPALQLAGLSTTADSTVNSLKPFIISLPGLLDSGSKQESGALDITPAWMLGLGGQQSPDSYYNSSDWFRLAFRSHIGAVIYRGDSGDGDPSKVLDSRLAIGYSVSLLNYSDPLMARAPGQVDSAWFTCLKDKSELVPVVTNEEQQDLIVDQGALGGPGSADQKALDKAEADLVKWNGITESERQTRANASAEERKTADLAGIKLLLKSAEPSQAALNAISKCAQKASDTAQHNAALDFGIGAVLDGEPGKIAGFEDPGVALWLSGRYPLQRLTSQTGPCDSDDDTPARSELGCWMLGGSARWSEDEFVSTGDKLTPTFRANTINAWLGIERIDQNSSFAFSGGYLSHDARDQIDSPFSETGFRWLISGTIAMKRLSPLLDGIWLAGSYGTAHGTVTNLDDKTFTLTINFTAPKSSNLF